MSFVPEPGANLTPEQRFEAGMLKCAAYYLVDPAYMGQPVGSHKRIQAYVRTVELIEEVLSGNTSEESVEPRVPEDLGDLMVGNCVGLAVNHTLNRTRTWTDRNLRSNGPVDRARSFLDDARNLAVDLDFREDHTKAALHYGTPRQLAHA